MAEGKGAFDALSLATEDSCNLAVLLGAAGVNVTNDRTAALDNIASAVGAESSMIEASPFALIGPPQQLVEDLLARRERWGFSYVIVGADDVEPFAPVVAALSGT